MIRDAVGADLDRIVEMGLHFLNDSHYKNFFEENPAQMRKLAERLLAEGGILVAEKDSKLVGMLGYVVYDHFISGQKTCGEVFWWVELEARGAGLRLLREVERRARARGCVLLQMVSPEERVGRMYELLGFSWVEATYQRAL